ncbi:MAG: hypothetical protein DHS20C21_18480 [Gemmatimonadota bacterium]|nr:MAG: hypothetical protein DHS20C21_18480 [Gemmatimonadota bacterium]
MSTKIQLVMKGPRYMGNQIEVPQNAVLCTADLPEGLTLDDVKMAIKHGDAALEEIDAKDKPKLFKVPKDKLPPTPEQQAAAEKAAEEAAKAEAEKKAAEAEKKAAEAEAKAAEAAKKQGSQGAAK